VADLPSCRQCQSLVRPHVVWFSEPLWPDVLEKINEEIDRCDLFLVVCLPFFCFIRLYRINYRWEHHPLSIRPHPMLRLLQISVFP
jgi:hypothetical protein